MKLPVAPLAVRSSTMVCLILLASNEDESGVETNELLMNPKSSCGEVKGSDAEEHGNDGSDSEVE